MMRWCCCTIAVFLGCTRPPAGALDGGPSPEDAEVADVLGSSAADAGSPDRGVLDAGAPDSGAAQDPLSYGVCPDGYLQECAILPVPLDHAGSSSATIDFHFAHYPAQTQPAKRQVWLLAGGPGQGGYVYGKLVAGLSARLPDAEIFVPDHRGTGYSHRLGCPAQDVDNSYGGYFLRAASGESCLGSLQRSGDYDRLAYFTSAQAAADVLAAIDRTRAPGEKVYVWGASYGTHWAHRMLQLRPEGIDGFIFDGFLTPEHFSFLDYDRAAEEAGERFAAACDADASCTSHLGPGGALAKIRAVLERLDLRRCGGFNKRQARLFLTLFLDSFNARALIFPMVHRLERCSAEDQTALAFLATTYNNLLTASYNIPFVNSGILQVNIVMSELWARPGEVTPTAAELDAAAEAQTFLGGGSLPSSLLPLRAIWPLPPSDYQDLPVPVRTNSKLLWLGADLDAHAFPSQAAAITTVYPEATYLSLPGAAHVPSRQSPLAADHADNCGMHIVQRFIEGDGAIDTSCTAALEAPIFEAPDEAFALRFWNTANDWGD
ncbi:MAG: alpha/beta fold hydrolase [Myxococcota bacterium]